MDEPLSPLCQGRQCLLAATCRRHQDYQRVAIAQEYHREGQFNTIANCDPETRELYVSIKD